MSLAGEAVVNTSKGPKWTAFKPCNRCDRRELANGNAQGTP